MVAACRFSFDPVAAALDGSPGHDDSSGQDADVSPDGDGSVLLGPWSAPVPIPAAATTGEEQDVTGSSDKLEIYWLFSNCGGSPLFFE